MSRPSTIDPFPLQLARLLHDLRARAGFSQEALASELRLDQATVSRIESGRRRVEVGELLAWVAATSTDVDATVLDVVGLWTLTTRPR